MVKDLKQQQPNNNKKRIELFRVRVKKDFQRK